MEGVILIHQNNNGVKYLFTLSILFFVLISSLNIVSADEGKVLFDESGSYGKYFTIYNIGPTGSSIFANLLESNGYKIYKTESPPITLETLQEYDVVILMLPYRNYTDSELSALKQYVKNGGGLFLMGTAFGVEDGGDNAIFNRIARSFGVDYAYSQMVYEPKDYLGMPSYFKATVLKTEPVTSNLEELYTSQTTYLKNPGNSTVVAYSSSDSWADKTSLTEQGSSLGNENKDPTEPNGPFPLFSVMEYGNGKVAFSSSVFQFTNTFIYRSNGWKFGLNTVNWLANKPIPSTYNTAGPISLTLGNTLYKIVGNVILLIVLILALFYMKKREEKIGKNRIIKIIKNWKYIVLAIINVFFTLLGIIMFFPINIILFDGTQPQTLDPYFGYSLLISGTLFLICTMFILFNMIFRKRIMVMLNYATIAVLLFFVGFTTILNTNFSFPFMEVFTIGSVVLLVPYLLNLWVVRGHGQDIIIEGKEFNRLAKLSVKSLPYELHGLYTDAVYIGEGGFGRVYKAKREDGREVALKIPKSFDKRAEKSFITEVSNWSQLDNPYIVKLYQYKILPIPYIETELCESPLEHREKPINQSLTTIHNIAKGLSYAHSKNIIHGDVKTSNIMLCGRTYKISDWGLSKLKTGESITLSGATPQYAAPEQITQEFGKADERTDVYQLGTVFYELVTGRVPFEGEMSQVYDSILNKDPKKPSEINPLASEVEPIIMKCLNKVKSERYSSMDELIKDLEKIKPEEFKDETILFDQDTDKKKDE